MLKLATHPLAQRVAQWPSHPAAVYSSLQWATAVFQWSTAVCSAGLMEEAQCQRFGSTMQWLWCM